MHTMASSKTFTPLGASNHTKSERQKEDFYASPATSITRLVQANPNILPRYIYEPCCGTGSLSEIMKKQGCFVYSADLVDRGYGEETGVDFLGVFELPKPLQVDEPIGIVTNPPFSILEDFIEHSLYLMRQQDTLLLLLKTLSLEGYERYAKFYSKGLLHKVYQFHKRITCAINADFENNSSGAVAYAWYEFHKYPCRNTIIEWI